MSKLAIEMQDTTLIPEKPLEIKPPKKKKKVVFIIILILVFILTAVGGFFGYKALKAMGDVGFKFNASDILNKKEEPTLKKDSTGKYTNVLIIGIDTRETYKLLNTDTIMLASYNYETNNVVLLSVPRDFHVQLPDKYWFQKINSIYSYAGGEDEREGLDALKGTVETVTNQEIQYYAMVDLKGFIQIIDAVGGVTVNVENSFTDYMYPDGLKYQTVKFVAGPQTMDGETALKYSRSRHSSQNGEGSDFARARRQQKVIIALKDKLLSSETLLSPTKILDLMSAVQSNLQVSEFTTDEIQAGVDLLKSFQEQNGQIYSFVLDPSAGNYTLITSKDIVSSGAYAIGPILGLGEYEDIHEYISLIMNYPAFYEQDPSVYVYDSGLGAEATKAKVKEMKDQFPYTNIKYMGTLFSDKEGIYVYCTKEDSEKIYSRNELAKFLNTQNTTVPEFITSPANGHDITILFGKEVSDV